GGPIQAANCHAASYRSGGAEGNVNRAPPRRDRSHPWQDASGRSARHGSGRSALHALGSPRAALAATAFFRLLPRQSPDRLPTPSVAKLRSCAPNCRCNNIGHNFGAYIWCGMTVYGYARVSTTGQTLATQKAMLLAAGVERISSEKASGVAARRPKLERTLDELEAGDVLVVTKLDRLARSTLDLLRIIDLIGKEGAGFKSLGDPWADTTTPHGRLMLTVLSGIAEFERSLILQRTNEGR